MTSFPLQGSCLCGQVRYQVASLSSREMAHCHCADCRKFHGAAYSTFAETCTLQWTSGRHLLKAFVAPNGSRRQFCSHCGSSLTFQPQCHVDTEALEFAIATLDDDGHSDSSALQPDAHVFVRSKVPWIQIQDGLTQYTEDRP
jgi:hypothetical protein